MRPNKFLGILILAIAFGTGMSMLWSEVNLDPPKAYHFMMIDMQGYQSFMAAQTADLDTLTHIVTATAYGDTATFENIREVHKFEQGTPMKIER